MDSKRSALPSEVVTKMKNSWSIGSTGLAILHKAGVKLDYNDIYWDSLN